MTTTTQTTKRGLCEKCQRVTVAAYQGSCDCHTFSICPTCNAALAEDARNELISTAWTEFRHRTHCGMYFRRERS